MYYWQETYENILDSAPRPKRRCFSEAKTNTAGGSGPGRGSGPERPLQCLCVEGPRWRDEMGSVLSALERVCPQPLVKAIREHMDSGLCCCSRRKLKQKNALNLPEDIFEQDLWDLFTFFLNGINIESSTLSLLESSAHDDRSKHVLEQQTTTSDAAAAAGKQPASYCACAEPVSNEQHAQFSNVIFEILQQCVTHKNIHRYILLREFRAMFQYLGHQNHLTLEPDALSDDKENQSEASSGNCLNR